MTGWAETDRRLRCFILVMVFGFTRHFRENRRHLVLRIELALLLGISTALAGNAFAQPGGSSRGGAGGTMPGVGTMLPDITLYDDAGKEFSTTSLRGQYSVLVFGCLT